MARPVRVAIANDYLVVVAGLTAICAGHRDQVVVVGAGLEVPADEVDVVLYDTYAWPGSLTELVASTRAKVVIFSAVITPSAVDQARRAGIAGYLYKGLSEERLVAALESVHVSHGEMFVDLAEQIDVDVYRSRPGQAAGLTLRESEILALICQGCSNHEITQRLFLSINSVKTYIRTAYRKMGVTSRSQAVIWGIAHNFVPSAA